MAMALGNGAQKYGPYNWRVEPVQGRIYLEAAERHLNLLLDGEDFDRDTGIHHGAFVLSTIAIYLDAMVHGTLIDNRPISGRSGDLVAFFNRTPGVVRTKEELRDGFVSLLPQAKKRAAATTKSAPIKRSPKPKQKSQALKALDACIDTYYAEKEFRRARR